MSPRMDSCRVEAPAKINLTLEILGKRPDGYHDIRSVVTPIALHDTVELRVASSDSLESVADGVSIEAIGPAEDNLCLKAVRLFRDRFGFAPGISVRLVKRIPIGGGLGGGSSDCAATLVGLAALAGVDPSYGNLSPLAASLGSDIPALLHGGLVLMEGRGERVTALRGPDGRASLPPLDIVLANPGVHVSTAAAYRNLTGLLTCGHFSSTILHSPLCNESLSAFAAGMFNGFEQAVFGQYPEVARLAGLLREAGAQGVLMSGSGSSVFALAKDPEDANRIKRAMPGQYWCEVTQTMPDGVMAAHGPLEP